jgi:hypothetical protein
MDAEGEDDDDDENAPNTPRRIRIRDRGTDRCERENDPNIAPEQPVDAHLFRHQIGEMVRAMHKDGKFYQATVCPPLLSCH